MRGAFGRPSCFKIPGSVMADDPQQSPPTRERREPPRLVARLQERRESYRERGRIYRAAWVAAGFIVMATGAAMVVLPGPALVVIPIGLAMLSLEFAWAERLLETTLQRGVAVKDVALQASRRQKILGAAALVFGVAAVVAVALMVLF